MGNKLRVTNIPSQSTRYFRNTEGRIVIRLAVEHNSQQPFAGLDLAYYVLLLYSQWLKMAQRSIQGPMKK